VWEALGLAAIAFAAAVALFIVKLPEIIWRFRNPQAKLAADRLAYLERVRRPDWDFYADHLRRPAPEALKHCYADEKFITGGGFEIEIEPAPDKDLVNPSDDGVQVEVSDSGGHHVEEFLAIDPRGLVEAWEYWHRDILPFARGDGFAYFLWPGAEESNAVYSACEEVLDDGIRSRVADDVSIFVEKLRAGSSRP